MLTLFAIWSVIRRLARRGPAREAGLHGDLSQECGRTEPEVR